MVKRTETGSLQKEILSYAEEGCRLRTIFFQEYAQDIVDTGKMAAICLARGNKILLCGNGGSAADAQHIAAELSGRFEFNRPGLAGLALTTDSSVLTAVGNDFGFDQIFERQVQALGQAGDILIGISTSGHSSNVLRALRAAKEQDMDCIGFCGMDTSGMKTYCQTVFSVPAVRTALIQEIHIAAGHLFCHIIDHFLFEAVAEIEPHLTGQST